MDPEETSKNSKYSFSTKEKLRELGDRASKLGTSLTEDTVDEIEFFTKPDNSDLDLLSQYKKTQKDIPDNKDDNILIQEEWIKNFLKLESLSTTSLYHLYINYRIYMSVICKIVFFTKKSFSIALRRRLEKEIKEKKKNGILY